MIFRLLSLFLLLSFNMYAAPYSAFHDGESFRFKVSWGLFSNAGEIKVFAKREVLHNRAIFRISMITSTRGIVRGLYTYDDTAEALIDEASGRIISASEKVEGERPIDSLTVFDYTSRLASHKDAARPTRDMDIPIPDGDPIDLLTALIGTRNWTASPGDKRFALIFAGRDIYPVNIYAEAFENIRYKGKDTQTLLLIPKMDSEPARGIFKRGGEIKVWIAQKGERLPLRMQLKLKIGTARLTLVDHQLDGSTQGSVSAKP